MCNFVPNECIAIAPMEVLKNKLPQWMFPGRLLILSACFEESGFTDELFPDYGIAHVVDIPDGLEVLVVSKLSAALSEEIAYHRAIVELNYKLPLATSNRNEDRRRSQPEVGLMLSPPAEALRDRIRSLWDSKPTAANKIGKIGVIDSGINTSVFSKNPEQRNIVAYDYVADAVASLANSKDDKPLDHDHLGHGTRVAGILDAVLPPNVGIASGRLLSDWNQTTVLRTVRAYMHLVSKERPWVVNLSFGPSDDILRCSLRHPVQAQAFYSNMLPFVFNLAYDRQQTIPVMAAGNEGRPCSARFILPDTQQPIYVIATGSSGIRANYSNYVDNINIPWLSAFGGDDDTTSGIGVYLNDKNSSGTSFAAPFVSGYLFIMLALGKSLEAIMGVQEHELRI